MKPDTNTKDLFKGALILTVAGLIIKILSAVYRIPFQNIVGDVGFYIYQQVYPFYGIALALSTYGFPVVISKLYAEISNENDQLGLQQLFITSAGVLSLIGFIGFASLYWGADWLSAQMDDPQLAILLRVTSLTFLIFPIVSMLRGYYQGQGNMVPTAVSQVGEQIIRVSTIFFAALILTRNGDSLYMVGGGATFGSITGGLTAMIILLTFYWKRRGTWTVSYASWQKGTCLKLAKVLMIQGFAVCISGMLLVFMQLADSLNLYSMLISAGVNAHEAKELKGIFDRGQPLIQVGMVAATSMSLTLVPIITSENVKSRLEHMHEKIRLSIKISLFIGVAAAFGLWNIIEPTNIMLFENNVGSDVLGVLSLVIFFSSIIMTVSAILQGLGVTLFPAFIIFLGFMIKYGLNIWFVPLYGTMGAAIATCISLGIMMTILLVKLRFHLRVPILDNRFLFHVSFAALIMVMVLRVYLLLTDYSAGFSGGRLFSGFQALSAVSIGGLCYLWIMIKGGTFKERELAMLPFGSKLLFLLPKKE